MYRGEFFPRSWVRMVLGACSVSLEPVQAFPNLEAFAGYREIALIEALLAGSNTQAASPQALAAAFPQPELLREAQASQNVGRHCKWGGKNPKSLSRWQAIWLAVQG